MIKGNVVFFSKKAVHIVMVPSSVRDMHSRLPYAHLQSIGCMNGSANSREKVQ